MSEIKKTPTGPESEGAPSTTVRPLRVVLADDHPIWREAIERDLREAGIEVVGVAADGAKAVRVCEATRPDVLVSDLQMPEMNGVEVAAALAPSLTKVLVLSASGEHADVLAAITAGASGYLTKSASAAELVEAIRDTAAGKAVFSPGLAGLVLGEYKRLETGSGAGPTLSEREREVLRLVAKGLTARQAGERLFLSHRTVENHIQNTLRKLQLHNRAQLVRYAMEQGLDTE